MADETSKKTLTAEEATEGMIVAYMRSQDCDRARAEHTVRLAVRGSGARDAAQFLQVAPLVQNPAAAFYGADVIEWWALTAKMTTTPAGRAVLREAGRMMTLVDTPTDTPQ